MLVVKARKEARGWSVPHRELSRRREKGSKGWRESWPWVVKSSREARRLG